MNEKQWAAKLLSLMGNDLFSEFAEFIDGCDHPEFSGACAELDEENFPEKY